MQNLTLERRPRVCSRTGYPPSTLHEKINAGEFVPPIKIGRFASAWPAHETDQIIAARIAGKTPAEIRALVEQLIEARKTLPERIAR